MRPIEDMNDGPARRFSGKPPPELAEFPVRRFKDRATAVKPNDAWSSLKRTKHELFEALIDVVEELTHCVFRMS